jgi:hypothetical protein
MRGLIARYKKATLSSSSTSDATRARARLRSEQIFSESPFSDWTSSNSLCISFLNRPCKKGLGARRASDATASVILCTCWPSVSFEAGLSSSMSIGASSLPLLFFSLGEFWCEALTILNMTGRSFTAAVFNAPESLGSLPLSPSTESTSVAILLQINVC